METQTSTKAVWGIDVLHSDIQFKVKHLMINTVTGQFKSFSTRVEMEDTNLETASIHFEADIDSIETNNEQRNGHLKSADFFDAENFPKLTFDSTSVTRTGSDTFDVVGNLTIRGTTLPVTLKATAGGTMVDFYGNTKAGFDLEGTIKRKAYGLSWDAITEAGGVVVSDDVRLVLNVQLVKEN